MVPASKWGKSQFLALQRADGGGLPILGRMATAPRAFGEAFEFRVANDGEGKDATVRRVGLSYRIAEPDDRRHRIAAYDCTRSSHNPR
jgi:hypothetical protein